MKVITILIVTGLVFSVAGQSTSTDKSDEKKSETKKVTRTPDPPAIPKDATPLEDGSFRYVDKAGKKWIYKPTPFGVSKSEEHAPPPPPKVEDDLAKSEDLGDSVRFTRPSPFGSKVWTTKKSELSDYEKTIWERDQKKTHGEPSKHEGTGQPNQSAAKQD